MKRFLFLILAASLVTGVFAAQWGRMTPIETKDLPNVSRQIISKYFNLSAVSFVAQYPDNYGVEMNGDCKLNFYKDGSLKEAEAKAKALPKNLLKELPREIDTYTFTKYSSWSLVEIEVKRSKIEVEFEKGDLEAKLTFDRQGRLLKEKIKD